MYVMVRNAQAHARFIVDEDSRESSIEHADRASWVCVIGAFGYFGAALISGQAASGRFVIIMGGSRGGGLVAGGRASCCCG